MLPTAAPEAQKNIGGFRKTPNRPLRSFSLKSLHEMSLGHPVDAEAPGVPSRSRRDRHFY